MSTPELFLEMLNRGRLEEAITLFNEGIRADPEHPKWPRCRMELLCRQGSFQEALTIAQSFLQEKDDAALADPILWHTIARIHNSLGAWQKSLQIFDSLRSFKLYGDGPIATQAPLWQGEILTGKTVCIATEGGVGDVICYVRFAKELKKLGAKVIVATYPPLFELLTSMPDIDFLIDRSATDRVYFDYWVPALSLPRLLFEEQNISGVPYLKAPQKELDAWRFLVTDPRPRVGICWQGRKEFAEDHLRSIPACLLMDLLDIDTVSWYKIQLFEGDNTLSHPNLKDFTRYISNPSHLAAHIGSLDLLISVDSGPAHIGGAFGIQTWLLNRFFGWITFSCPQKGNAFVDISPLDGNYYPQKSIWYDSMVVFTQEKFGDWDKPIQAVKELLPWWAQKFKGSTSPYLPRFPRIRHSIPARLSSP